jgi:hypothetical protein
VRLVAKIEPIADRYLLFKGVGSRGGRNAQSRMGGLIESICTAKTVNELAGVGQLPHERLA